MPLHQLAKITIGVPNPAETADYYAEFGLTPAGDGSFETVDGGEQLRIEAAPTRRLIELTIGADDPDDLDRVARNLAALGVAAQRSGDTLTAVEPVAGFRATVTVRPRSRPRPTTAPAGPSGSATARPACCAATGSGRSSWATWWSAPPTTRPRSGS